MHHCQVFSSSNTKQLHYLPKMSFGVDISGVYLGSNQQVVKSLAQSRAGLLCLFGFRSTDGASGVAGLAVTGQTGKNLWLAALCLQLLLDLAERPVPDER